MTTSHQYKGHTITKGESRDHQMASDRGLNYSVGVVVRTQYTTEVRLTNGQLHRIRRPLLRDVKAEIERLISVNQLES